MSMLAFSHFTLTSQTSEDTASGFLQGQITADVAKLTQASYTPTAICNLKGRVDFGLWIRKQDNAFDIVISADCADDFSAHIKKYGAFSKLSLSDPQPISPVLTDGQPTFSTQTHDADVTEWLATSIAQGNAVITTTTRGLFQPQPLRLHQRGGVHYDKGCYLGQEVVARLWFKASPKAWLHRVTGTSAVPEQGMDIGYKTLVVNAVATKDGYEALVIARPVSLKEIDVSLLPLPEELDGSVARET